MQRRVIVSIIAAIWLAAGTAAHADEKSAGAVVEALHASLLAMMKQADTLGFDGRRMHMEPVVAQSFDLPVIAVMASGANWRKFSEDQRQRLIDALERLSVATYAARFDGYSGESFNILTEQPAPQGAVFVNSELVKADGEAIVLKYLLHQGKAGWRILDVYFLGVYSELAMRRSEYAAVFQREGFDGLLSAIEQKTADYAAGLLQ